MIWDPNKINERPWPGVDGNSVQYEIGATGMAAPVVVLATPGNPGGHISCRDLKYADATTAASLANCLMAAVKIIEERHSDAPDQT